jgi:hypothetical protein
MRWPSTDELFGIAADVSTMVVALATLSKSIGMFVLSAPSLAANVVPIIGLMAIDDLDVIAVIALVRSFE